MDILDTDNIEKIVSEEAVGAPGSESTQRYLALCSTLHRGMEEFFEEVAKGLREREERGFPSARQASVMRLTYLRAENDACEALFKEVQKDEHETSGKPLQQARLLALVKMASQVISKTLSTCSFLLSEEHAIDRVLVNQALVFFAKLSSLFGVAGNPSSDTRFIADFIGLRSLTTH